MIDKSAIDPNALNYFRMLKSAGYAAYFVGGSVRDLLLGKTPKDFDIATNATPNQIKRVIPYGKIIGRRFRHVLLEKDGGRYEIVTFRGPVVEPTEDTDNDEAASPGNPQFKKRYPDLNQFGTAEEDASRRDFTINALFYDPDADELVDYVGGKKDIDNRLVRTIGIAVVRLKDDPIRILRAIRHKVKLGLEYSPELRSAIFEASPDLQNTSKDRIREEFLKVCMDRSLGPFLEEARSMKVSTQITPWFDDISEESWTEATKLWRTFKTVDPGQDIPSEVGLSLMVVPLVNEVILKSFVERMPKDRLEGGMLPDIKFFLGSEQMRNWLLRTLRISKIQTDTVLRACFYWSRMSGKWLEEGGPPKRIEGKLRSQPGALIGAFLAKISLTSDGKEVPEWLNKLASELWEKPAHHRGRFDRQDRGDRRDRGERHERSDRSHSRDNAPRESHELGADEFSEEPRSDRPFNRENREHGRRDRNDRDRGRNRDRDRDSEDHRPAPVALPVLEKPLVWNGPLHAPALRPIFHEEAGGNWLVQGQSAGYRPSGIPSAPVDKAYLSAKVTNNYKPEFSGNENEEQSHAQDRNDPRRGRDRDRGRGRGGRHQGGNRPHPQAQHAQRNEAGAPPELEAGNPPVDNENDIGYAAGDSHEAHADALVHQPGYTPYDDEDPDDNIGNRIDGPPTSGYVADPVEGAAPDPNDLLTSHSRQMGQRHGGGGGGAPRRRGGRRRGGRNRRGGGGGGGRSGSGNHPPGGGRSQNFRENT